MSGNRSSERFRNFNNPNSDGTLNAEWLIITFKECDLPRDIINEGMKAVIPKPRKWMVAKDSNLPVNRIMYVLVEYDRETTINPNIFNFFGGQGTCKKIFTNYGYVNKFNNLRTLDPEALYYEMPLSNNSERYYDYPQDIIAIPSSDEEENHTSPRRRRSRSRSPQAGNNYNPSILGHQYRMRRNPSPSSSLPPRPVSVEIPLHPGTSANRNSQAPSTSPSLTSSPTQAYDPETYIGPLPPKIEPAINQSSPQELKQGNNHPDPSILANRSPPTFESNAGSSAKKRAESNRPCAKKVSFADQMVNRSSNNTSIESQRRNGDSNHQGSSNPSRKYSNEAPRPVMRAPKSDRRPPNEENSQARQLGNAENPSSNQAEQILRDLANTRISSPSIHNQELVSINLSNENQINVVELEIRDKNHRNLGRIGLILELKTSEAEIPNGGEDFWECQACKNINSTRIEFCPRCKAHRFRVNH